jgi:paraquat-inducible protein B
MDSAIFYDANHTGDENLKQAVKEGLRASIKERDPITGLQYIELIFTDTNETNEIIEKETYALFPTQKDTSVGLMSGLNGLMKAIEKLPLEQLILSMDRAINSVTGILETNKDSTKNLLVTVDKTLNSVNTLVQSKAFKEIPEEISETLEALQQSLKSLDSVIKGNSSQSLLSSQMTQTLKEVSQTSRDTQKLLNKLERKPNSLLFGD